MRTRRSIINMNFTIENLWNKTISHYYSDTHLAKSYVIYSVTCNRVLTSSETERLIRSVLRFTLSKNRLFVNRVWIQSNVIYFVGTETHGCGYSWDTEVIDAFYPLLNSLSN